MGYFIKLLNRLRREFFKMFNSEFYFDKLKKRIGNCKQCGECCIGCKYLKNNKCSVYNNRPWFCYKEFPLDKLDQKVFGVKNCGYSFKTRQ
jgi:hypothetical protein